MDTGGTQWQEYREYLYLHIPTNKISWQQLTYWMIKLEVVGH